MPRRTVIQFVAVMVSLLGASLLMGRIFQPDDLAACVLASGPAIIPEIPEASGLALSRRNPGLIWSHNDSGNAAVLFAFDAAGTLQGRVRVQARTRDWEDVSAARCPSYDCLYIADIGNNRLARRQFQIYRVPEPAPGDAETSAPEAFNATYVDGPHNAEAMFVIGEDLFIITRDRIGAVYRASVTPSAGRELTFQRIGELGLQAVTDAEASPDEKSVVVRTSRLAVVYRTADLIDGRSVPYFRISIEALREPQGEGVALDGSSLYLASEGRPWNRAGRIVSLRCNLPP